MNVFSTLGNIDLVISDYLVMSDFVTMRVDCLVKVRINIMSNFDYKTLTNISILLNRIQINLVQSPVVP